MLIHKLAVSVSDKIAAGEVLARPCNAVKELIENAKDANARSIRVSISSCCTGITVTDDGDGIDPDDLPLLCERFATSKLRSFDDLPLVRTFGFRGEALASISQVSRLSVTTKRRGSPVGVTVSYRDGRIVGTPTRCACPEGSIFRVESLFFNLPTRREALHPADEYAKCLLVCQRYALLWRDVSVCCERECPGKPPDLCVTAATPLERIGEVYGQSLAKALIPLDLPIGFGWATSRVVSGGGEKKLSEFILFVNSRLVDCLPLKRAIAQCYENLLGRRQPWFIFLALTLPSQSVDVNVHPTKSEVFFLDSDRVISQCALAVEAIIAKDSTTHKFTPDVISSNSPGSSPQQNVRVDCHDRDIRSSGGSSQPASTARRNCLQLESVEFLLAKAERESAPCLADCVWVGCDESAEALFLQQKASLVTLPIRRFLEGVFWRKTLLGLGSNWENLIEIPLRFQGSEDLKNIHESSEMLLDYFSLSIDKATLRLPNLLPGAPIRGDLDVVPWLQHLNDSTDWESERDCLNGVATALSLGWSNWIVVEERWLGAGGFFEQEMKRFPFPASITSAIRTVTTISDLYKVFERC